MYDEYFKPNKDEYEWQEIKDINEVKLIANNYFAKYYSISDNKEDWFNKMKELSSSLGYATDMKEYKENPSKYKGSIADIATVIRVAITTKANTPDLYEILRILGTERINKRITNL